MVYNKKIVLFITALFIQVILLAQNTASAEAAANNGFMRSEGKIYVAMTVAVTILIGLIIFVGRLDRKISRLERKSV